MSAQQELIDRLRQHAASAPVISRQSIDMEAAADRLASLSAELEALRGKLAGVDEKALTSSPLIEAITPAHAEWRACVTVQDTYDMMKHKLRAAIAAYLAAVGDKG